MNTKHLWIWSLAGLLWLGFSLAIELSEVVAADKAYYEGKTIKLIVSSSPGGGTDTAARLVVRFLPKYLPGNPQTIVQNMPGGGGTISNNYFFREAKPDGLTLLQDSSSGLTNFTRGGPTIKYDPRQYRTIGAITRGGSVLMVRKDAKPRLMDPKATALVVGDADGIRTWVAMTVWAAEYLGWNLRWIYGYPGTGELVLALRQGEFDMFATQNAKIIQGLVKDGVVDLLAQQDDERRSDFSDVPTFDEILGAKKPSGISWQAYQVWEGPGAVDKFLVAPKGTPDDVVRVLREAFSKMGQDPEFKDQATKFFGAAWRVRPGGKTEALIREVTTVAPETMSFLTKIRKKYGLPAEEPKKEPKKKG